MAENADVARQVSVRVMLRDVSEPAEVAFTEFKGGYRILVSAFSGVAAALVILAMPYLMFLMHVHIMENNQLPPPFYRHRLKYRGW